jgi:uncharacterized protein (TIGR00290 family)
MDIITASDKTKLILCWSGGKDSALALYELMQKRVFIIKALLTTITKEYDRISMHGVRTILLEQQGKKLKIPIEKVYISKNSSNEEYENSMKKALLKFNKKRINNVAFGDIFLEDVRKYRETNLQKVDMKAIFPLWNVSSKILANKFIDLGFKAILTCVDTQQLDGRFSGREFNKKLLEELPSSVDPCGENGEFHTFVYDGPIFKKRIKIKKGDVILRDNRFNYCEILPD